MAILAALGIALAACGWLIGRPRALLAAAIIPLIAAISGLEQRSHEGQFPETWVPATALFTFAGVVCVAAGLLARRCTAPRHRDP